MQRELFDDPYDAFGDFVEDYPKHTFKGVSPPFSRRAEVAIRMGKGERKFLVDLNIGECECPGGQAWAWDNDRSKWYAKAFCTHKLRMMASVVENAAPGAKDRLYQEYIISVGTRYNVWEVASAFHKELRRGDFTKAFFWGMILGTKRGTAGIFKYLLNIIYEETRDHEMALWLIEINHDRSRHNYANISKAIRYFCQAKKKWELPERLAIFEAEMRGYQQLVKEFGTDVAKGSKIIAAEQKLNLLDNMKRGFAKKNLPQVQYGLKGLQKLDCDDLDQHRYWIYEQLYEYIDATIKFTGKPGTAWDIIEVINARIAAGFGIGYHEINALADAIAGETVSVGTLAPLARKAVLAAPSPAHMLGIWPAIPIYAHDNHTYRGKQLIRKWPEELKPDATQEHLDFRLCGAYFGVAWRMQAYNQHGSIDIPWDQVNWATWLYNVVMSLWY